MNILKMLVVVYISGGFKMHHNTDICTTNKIQHKQFNTKNMARKTFYGDDVQLIFSNNRIGDCVIDMIETVDDEEIWLQYIVSKKDIPKIIRVLEEIQQNKF